MTLLLSNTDRFAWLPWQSKKKHCILKRKSALLHEFGRFAPKFRYDESSPTNYSSCQKTRMIGLSYDTYLIIRIFHIFHGAV